MIYNLKLFHEAELIMSELCTSKHTLVTGTMELFEGKLHCKSSQSRLLLGSWH